MAKLVMEAMREGYALSQIDSTMTVGELIDLLSQYSEDTEVYLSHDGGYTYGGFHEGDFDIVYDDEEDDYE